MGDLTQPLLTLDQHLSPLPMQIDHSSPSASLLGGADPESFYGGYFYYKVFMLLVKSHTDACHVHIYLSRMVGHGSLPSHPPFTLLYQEVE